MLELVLLALAPALLGPGAEALGLGAIPLRPRRLVLLVAEVPLVAKRLLGVPLLRGRLEALLRLLGSEDGLRLAAVGTLSGDGVDLDGQGHPGEGDLRRPGGVVAQSLRDQADALPDLFDGLVREDPGLGHLPHEGAGVHEVEGGGGLGEDSVRAHFSSPSFFQLVLFFIQFRSEAGIMFDILKNSPLYSGTELFKRTQSYARIIAWYKENVNRATKPAKAGQKRVFCAGPIIGPS